MGAFVLGVLVGWLAEWVFFTFWVKGGTTGKSADCSGLEAELSAKNKELATLKTELDSAKQSNASATTIKDAVKATKTTKSAVSTTKKATAKKATKTSKTTKAIAKATSTTAGKKQAKTKAKRTVATKKAVTAKKAPVKKTATKTTKKRAVKAKGDDFTLLTGVGPSMAAKIKGIGISSFKALAAMDDDDLRDKLEAAGARLNTNKDAMDTWNEQALLAEKGDFEGLKKFQDTIKK